MILLGFLVNRIYAMCCLQWGGVGGSVTSFASWVLTRNQWMLTTGGLLKGNPAWMVVIGGTNWCQSLDNVLLIRCEFKVWIFLFNLLFRPLYLFLITVWFQWDDLRMIFLCFGLVWIKTQLALFFIYVLWWFGNGYLLSLMK